MMSSATKLERLYGDAQYDRRGTELTYHGPDNRIVRLSWKELDALFHTLGGSGMAPRWWCQKVLERLHPFSMVQQVESLVELEAIG